MATTIKQKKYGKLEIETREKDIVEIWNFQKDCELIQIERKNLKKVVEVLTKEINKKCG